MEVVDNKFDGIILKMIEDTKGYDGFFDLVFSTLRRKTDFFSQKNVAEKTIAEAGKKHILQYMEDQKKKQNLKKLKSLEELNVKENNQKLMKKEKKQKKF